MGNEQIRDLPGIFRQNDASKIRKYREQLVASTDTLSFQDFIDKKMKDGGFTRESLVMSLGYSGSDTIRKKTEIMKKTINTVGYTTNRDRIIAICIALSLSKNEVDKALCLYGMLPLDEYDARDSIIIAAIYEQEDFSTVNHWLTLAKLPVLSIEKTVITKAPRTVQQPKKEYKIIEAPSAVCGDFVGDTSLSGLYNPGTYDCDAEMTVQASDGTTYQLSAGQNGNYHICHQLKNGRSEVKFLKSLDECMNNEFKDYFLLLEDAARRKIQDVLCILNDTKNYIARVDAFFSVDSLVIFAETFNYDDPESSEYYQMEYCNGKYTLYTSHHSVFLERHLGSQYPLYFTKSEKSQPIQITYPPVIASNPTKAVLRNNDKISKYYSKLKTTIDDMVTQIKNGTTLVYDPYSLLDDIFYDLAGIYGLREKFTWDQEDGPNMIPIEDACDVITSDGTQFKLTLSDMKRAFELAIPSVDAIYKVIQKHGSINDLLI